MKTCTVPSAVIITTARICLAKGTDLPSFFVFIYWLFWVFVAASRLSLVAASGSYSSLQHRLLIAMASLVAEHATQ